MNKFLLFFFSVFSIIEATAQSITAEPASFYGLGEKSTKGHAVYDALGKNAVNVLDSGILNHNNPASYNRLSKGSTLYTLGLHSRQSWYQSGTLTQFNATPPAKTTFFEPVNFLASSAINKTISSVIS